MTSIRPERPDADQALSELIASIQRWGGLILTREQLSALAERTPTLQRELRLFGGNDTATRELALTVLSQELIGRDWPCMQDEVDMTLFMNELRSAAVTAGYALPEQTAVAQAQVLA